jgi:hypothetical protein
MNATLTRFEPLSEVSGKDLKYGLIDNSQTLSIGEVLVPAVQGDVAVVNTGGGTTGALLGVVRGVVGKGLTPILEYNSYAAEADNVTDKMVQVSYVPMFLRNEWAGALDADAETTDNSQAYGNFAVDSTGLLLDEDSYVAYTTVIAKQFFSYGVIPASVRNVSGVFIKQIGNTA